MNGQKSQELKSNEKHIVLIAAFTATGDLAQLKRALNDGLNGGLTINQIREELVQLYAYCGFLRSLNGITTFMSVLEERKSMGIQDAEGQAPTAVTGDNKSKYEGGRKTLETLTGKPQSGPLTGANAFAPGIDAFLKGHLFADIFGPTPTGLSTSLPDFKAGSVMSYSTAYRPDKTAIDTFYVDYQTHTVKADVTSIYLSNTGPFQRATFDGRWGTLAAPWITNAAAKNKDNGVNGGYTSDAGGAINWEHGIILQS